MVSETTVTVLCDLLEGSGCTPAPADVPLDDVVVVRGGRIVGGARSDDCVGIRSELTLEDGSVLPAAAGPGLTACASGMPPRELPLGIHTLHWSAAGGPERETTVIVAPAGFPSLSGRSPSTSPTKPRDDRPGAGVFVPTYALWSTETQIPAFESLVALADAVDGYGIDCIATLPLFAPGLGARLDPSPYSPVSRFHLNEIYAAGSLPASDAAGQGPHSSADGYIDWPATASEVLVRIIGYRDDLDAAGMATLGAFLALRPDVVSYAAFCATEDVPQRVYEVGQWLAERSLEAVVADLHARGVRLALDLPVGSRPDSWEHREWPELFSDGASIGAPPDSFFEGGQDWGLPPPNPIASRRDGHRMWHDLLANAARHADVLRIDHVMQVMRLWWVPVGSGATEGTYVSYPANELLAVAALVAARTGTAMVGENLGTVPPEMVSLMADWGLPGMHEELFALHDMAADPGALSRVAPLMPEVPRGSWAGLRTHDMMPVSAVASEVDTEPYCRALESELGHAVAPGVGSLTAAMIQRLARSPAGAVVVDLDDALGSTVPHNVPGTVTEKNWSHRLPVPVADLADEPGFQRNLSALNAMTGQR